MLDAHVRKIIDPPLNLLGKVIARMGGHANAATIMGLFAGGLAIISISQKYYLCGCIFIVINRLMDGVDGAIARASKITDFGGFLDISTDFVIYAGVIFAFAFSNPEYALWAAFLIFSYIGPMTTFLAFAIMAEKKSICTNIHGKKSFYYMGGICEGTETAIAMIGICLFPAWFPEICLVYGILCWLTTAGRIMQAWELSKA